MLNHNVSGINRHGEIAVQRRLVCDRALDLLHLLPRFPQHLSFCTSAKWFLRLAHSMSNVVTSICWFHGAISRLNDSQYLIVEISPLISVQTSQLPRSPGSTGKARFCIRAPFLLNWKMPIGISCGRIDDCNLPMFWEMTGCVPWVENVIRTTVRIFVIWELRLVSLLHLTPRCRQPLISAYDPLAGSPFEVAEPKPQLALIQNTWY